VSQKANDSISMRAWAHEYEVCVRVGAPEADLSPAHAEYTDRPSDCAVQARLWLLGWEGTVVRGTNVCELDSCIASRTSIARSRWAHRPSPLIK
jgi:hypothetical protein